MKRDEYIAQLKKYLKRLPKKEYDSAIEYFTEYFDEAGPERELEVIQELGQPKEAAKEMLLQLLNEGQTEEATLFLKNVGDYCAGFMCKSDCLTFTFNTDTWIILCSPFCGMYIFCFILCGLGRNP